MEVKVTGLSKGQARVAELVLISAYTLENLANGRREIALGNVAGFSSYMGSTIRLFGNLAHDELQNLMGR